MRNRRYRLCGLVDVNKTALVAIAESSLDVLYWEGEEASQEI